MPVMVETAAVATEDVDVSIDAVGTLQADQMVDLKPKRSGHIRELRFQEGQPVAEGDILVVMQDDDYRARLDQARASVTDAEVRERSARRQFDRTQELLKKGVASQQQYDDNKADLDRASAAIGVARANVALAEADLAYTVIKAPFAGTIGRRRADLGAFVREGESIATLVDLDPLELVFAVPERYLGQLHLDQSVETRVASYDQQVFRGTVTFVDPQVDPVNRTVTVKAVVDNLDGKLKPGQFATTRLRLDRHAGQTVVPEEAIVPSGERSFVFVVADNQATPREVRTGVRVRGRVEIIDGLKSGEIVVLAGQEKLRLEGSQPVTAYKEG